MVIADILKQEKEAMAMTIKDCKKHPLYALSCADNRNPTIPMVFWIEGLELSPDAAIIYKHTHEPNATTPEEAENRITHKDEIHFIIANVDLDVDSDNNSKDGIFGAPDMTQEEDDIEDPKRPAEIKMYFGKLVPVNEGYPADKPALVPMTLKLSDNLAKNEVKFMFEYNDKLKIWKDKTKSKEFTSKTKYDGAEVPETVYIEALPGAEELEDDERLITVKAFSTESVYGENEWVLDDTVRVRPIKITKVEWEEKDSPLDKNENAGGGLRIFPDKNDPFDATDHSKVIVRAMISPRLQNIPVFFKMFDVDDPSSDKKPIDDESKNYDNYGTKVPETIFSARTNKNGEAEIEYSVSMQPGDNFKAVTSVSSSFFDKMKAENAGRTDARVLNKDGNPVPSSNITTMFTVWRRLWIEIDSMDIPKNFKAEMDPDWNIVIINECVVKLGSGTTQIKVTAADGTNTKDCFEGGMLDTFHGKFPVQRNSKTSFWGNMEIIVTGELTYQQVKLLPNTLVTIKEDDQLSSLDHPTDIPDLAKNALKKAYIMAEKIPISYKHKFDIHTTYIDFVRLRISSVRSNNGFWYQLMINAFQGKRNVDHDPDGFFINQDGLRLSIGLEASDGGGSAVGAIDRWNVAALYLETIRDQQLSALSRDDKPWDYVLLFAHEIGHNGRNDTTHIEDGIMNKEGKSVIDGKTMDYYDDDTILKFRKQPVW
jgi:hypothetical protein